MKIIKPHFEILTRADGMEVLKMLELAGRTCYKSEDRITDISGRLCQDDPVPGTSPSLSIFRLPQKSYATRSIP